MKEVGPLLVLHGNCGITTALYHPDINLVCLSTFHHESLELGLRNTMPCHHIIEVLSKYHMRSSIFRLHIIDCNHHDLTLCRVIDVASHGGPLFDTLDVIEHDPCVLQISYRLHLFDQVHPGSGPHLRHLKIKHFVCVQAVA